MESHRDELDPSHHQESEAVDSIRPPQFNESYCGYRCGYGCCEPREGDSDSDGGGGGSESDRATTTTLIGDEEQNNELRSAPPQQNFVVMGTPRPAGLPILGEIERQTGLVILTNGFDRVVVVSRNTSSNHLPRLWGHEYMMASLFSDFSGGYISSRNSNARSRGAPSPMSPGLHIPTWVEDGRIAVLPPEYHFVHPPLRLSPQVGLADSHTGDAESLINFLEDFQAQRATGTFPPFEL